MSLSIHDWSTLDEGQRTSLLARPIADDRAAHAETVAGIVAEVRTGGDAALLALTARFDRVELASMRVTPEELDEAERALMPVQRAALERAIANVRRFHEAQRTLPLRVETSPGVVCERFETPISAVGIYVPAGSAPLPSAAIMSAVPAAIAGCALRILCTPPRSDGRADPAILVAARLCGVTAIYKVGGAQAIAAMAYGTETIPKVDKIFGPGNAWVTAAKLLVAQDPAGAAFDLPAGPSEVLVVADDAADPEFVAADLLAQAEHDPSSHVVLLTPSRSLAGRAIAAIDRQQVTLSRRTITAEVLRRSRVILVADLTTALEVSNRYAPEHLILQVENARAWLSHVKAAGSVFLGAWTPEPMGDYCSGTNHVLPTYGYARAFSGLGLADFMRRITVQEITPAGLADLGPVAVTLAQLEGLDGHANAVTVRLRALGPR